MNKFYRAGTHVPVLHAIAKKYRIETITEIGSGYFSTQTFLDKNIFSDLKKLYTYEEKELWIENLAIHKLDKRWEPVVWGQKEDWMACEKFHHVDLVFVDGSTNRNHAVVLLKNYAPLIVMHDAEKYKKKKIAKMFLHYWQYQPPSRIPATLICSNTIKDLELDVKWNTKYKKLVEVAADKAPSIIGEEK